MGRRLWRNAEYYQANYSLLLLFTASLSVAADTFVVLRAVGMGVIFFAVALALAQQQMLPDTSATRRAWSTALNGMARLLGPARKDGTPEPTASVAAAVLLLLLSLLCLLLVLRMRCAQLGVVLVLAHLLARKPNMLSKATFVANAVGAGTRTPITAMAECAVAAAVAQ